MTAIEYLDQQVKQVCPGATGVSIGRWDDKRTWRVFSDDPVEQDRAREIFDAFDVATFVEAKPLTVEQRVAALEAKVK